MTETITADSLGTQSLLDLLHWDRVPADYELLDSGGGEKLERFGTKVIRRPSSLCAWRRRKEERFWATADATLDVEKGWRFANRAFESWHIRMGDKGDLTLRLQTNGQVGFFPEHALYLPAVGSYLERSPAKVLNLFAYTGMASVYCAQRGGQVTHVELSGKAIEWARENVQGSGLLGDSSPRYIKDDALKFVQAELRRGQSYDLIIADPPSFSRPTKGASWQLDEVLADLVSSLVRLVVDRKGVVLLSHHSAQSPPEIVSNLFLDAARELKVECRTEIQRLNIRETETRRVLPAGCLIVAEVG